MKNQKVFLILILLVLFLFSARATFATDIKTDYDRDADFSRYKTYCWQKVETQNPLWIDRIKAAVNSPLNAKGWSLVQSGSGCDVAVVAIFDAKSKKLVWRGSATDTLSDKSDKNIKKLNDSVQKLFEHFPPHPKA